MVVTVPRWRFFNPPVPTILPATAEERTCVVLTGKPRPLLMPIVPAATNSAAAPCAYVRCDFPIFSPMVITILFHPTMVPRPREKEIKRMASKGAKSVASLSADNPCLNFRRSAFLWINSGSSSIHFALFKKTWIRLRVSSLATLSAVG